MIIQLKQSEVETALRDFVAEQGISLSGKQVTVTFTAGRKESGVSAEVSIEGTEAAGVYEEPFQVSKLGDVENDSPEIGIATAQGITEDSLDVELPEPAMIPEPGGVTKTVSLFG